jgi:hypothetical protein
MFRLLALMPLFWLLSPESLRRLGNLAAYGTSGALFLISLGLISLAAFRAVRNWPGITGCESGETTQASPPRSTPGLILEFAAVLGTTLFGSTGMLVTAGYTFNEVFYYRFPNFGFAALLLVVLCFLVLFSARLMRLAGSVLLLIVLVCLAILTLTGLLSLDQASVTVRDPLPLQLPGLLVGLIFFVGVEQTAAVSRQEPAVQVYPIYLGTLIVLAGWLFVSSRFVAEDRLAFSSIGHMQAAFQVLGQPGRLLMGLAVICGCCGAVGLLLDKSLQLCAQMLRRPVESLFSRATVIVLGGAIGAAMMFGLAGSERLEILIRGSLVLWLFYSGFLLLTSISCPGFFSPRSWLAPVCALLYLAGSIYLVAVDPDLPLLAIFLTGWLVSSALCIIVSDAVTRGRIGPG